jgi:hypothetical protein
VSDNPLAILQNWADENSANELPMLVLPGNKVSITECATNLFKLIGPTKLLFMRGGAAMFLVLRDDGLLALEILHPDMARSFFEKFAQLFAWRTGAGGKPVLQPVTCSHDTAKALLQSQEASELLPAVRGLLNCPVLHEVDGELVVAGNGYDDSTKLLITDGDEIPVMDLDSAVSQLLQLFDEFDFQTEGDRARAVASLITPALKTGGFLKRRVPVDVAEADRSQSGKTYRQKIVAAIYNEKVSLVTCRTGGVGSVDESLNQALIAGRPFIQFDNFRGKFDSAHLEAFMTAEGSFSCRVPYSGEIRVSPENFFIYLTSNGVDTTGDFANRSSIIRIRKKPAGFAYTKFEEGDLLDRVRHWQAFYLGCVFAVIREWHRQGQPRTDETRHDFREWVQTLDWIIQNIFMMAPIMDGHQQAQERVSNPQLVWLRTVVLAIAETGELNRQLTATDLQRICESANIAIPGLRAEADEDRAKRVIGTIMVKLFGNRDELDVDGFTVLRRELAVARYNTLAGGSFKSKTYQVISR